MSILCHTTRRLIFPSLTTLNQGLLRQAWERSMRGTDLPIWIQRLLAQRQGLNEPKGMLPALELDPSPGLMCLNLLMQLKWRIP